LKNFTPDIAPEYLLPGKYTDSDHPEVIAFAREVAGNETEPVKQAVLLFYAVRDGFPYTYYNIVLTENAIKASSLLKKGKGYCVEKANLLGAAARALGIPSRFGFADVINHLGAEKLKNILRSEVFAFHGYTELYLEGKWVKATPAFNKSLCEFIGVRPLDFNGRDDAIFQEYDDGVRFMEYIHFHGIFSDIPLELFIKTLRKHYPHLFADTSKEKEMEPYFFQIE
jgi:hypothetical protein